MYNINENAWTDAPEMNYARHHHSGCTMSDYVYVFCGSSYINSNLNSIERLNVSDLISGDSNC